MHSMPFHWFILPSTLLITSEEKKERKMLQRPSDEVTRKSARNLQNLYEERKKERERKEKRISLVLMRPLSVQGNWMQ